MPVETEFDIAAASRSVIERFERREDAVALQLLEELQLGQPQVVQESLDRFICQGAAPHIRRLSNRLNQWRIDDELRETFRRLESAGTSPRLPARAEMDALASDAQRHDVYASIVSIRGSDSAREALDRNERVVLGLRQENSTLVGNSLRFPQLARVDNPNTQDRNEARLGTGVYDDRIVVLWRTSDGSRGLESSLLANTEPTAQYDAHARPGRAQEGGIFSDVAWRRAEGVDSNGDGVADLGRMAEGTFEMQLASHPTPGAGGGTHQALRPTLDAVGNGQGQVQRDSNGDGWFNANDIAGRQSLNNTFKIHMGSRQNTDSAGCQTLHPLDYPAFIGAVTADPNQTRWQYVLTSTMPSDGQGLQVEGQRVGADVRAGVAGEQVGVPQMPRGHLGDPQQRDAQQPGLQPGYQQRGDPGLRHERRDQDPGPAPATYRPDDPRHPDHLLLLQIRGIVREREAAGARDESADERLSRALLSVAKGSGMTRVDHLMEHGGRVFLVQGQLHDPANRHASIDTGVAMLTGLEQSDLQLEEIHRRLGIERAQQLGAHQSQGQPSEALSVRV